LDKKGRALPEKRKADASDGGSPQPAPFSDVAKITVGIERFQLSSF
jgi:hypothetical protein